MLAPSLRRQCRAEASSIRRNRTTPALAFATMQTRTSSTPAIGSNNVTANLSSVRRDPGYAGLTAKVESLPSAWYFDPLQHQRELAQIWYRNWIYVCRASELATVRSFRTFALGGQSLLLV